MASEYPEFNDEPGEIFFNITVRLMQIRQNPCDLLLHQAIRQLSLKYKVAGGKSAGMFELMKLKGMHGDPLEKMIHVEQAWARDPADIDLMWRMLRSVQELQQQRPDDDFEALEDWLRGIIRKATQ